MLLHSPLELKGTGVQPALAFSPSPVDFGEVTSGEKSAPRTVTIKNLTDRPVQVRAPDRSSIQTVSPKSLELGVQAKLGTCNKQLAKGASCQMILTVTLPKSGKPIGPFTATVLIGATATTTTSTISGGANAKQTQRLADSPLELKGTGIGSRSKGALDLRT